MRVLFDFFARKMASILPQTKTVRKLFVGYLLLVLCPILIFGYFVYNQTQVRFLEENLQNRQELIEQASSNLKVELTQAESVYQLFQYNQNILDYLNGTYDTELQYVYNLLEYIRPIYSFVYVGNEQIKEIRMYSMNSNVEILEPEFGRMDELIHKPEYAEIQNLLPGKGLWVLENVPSQPYPELNYYQKVYNSQFSKQIGVMKITLTDDAIKMLMEKVKTNKNDRVYAVSADKKVIYGDADLNEELKKASQSAADSLLEEKSGPFILNNRKVLGNKAVVESLGVMVISFTNEKSAFVNIKNELQWMGIAGLLCLMLLTAVYYWIVSSLTQRIVKLARHMRRVNSDNLSVYADRTNDRDEIDSLTTSYNAMLQRIDDLVNRVHRAELLRKEADYKVLEAQIRPHFLYNTLESIRMMAEVNEAQEVADFTYTFGKFIRYSLSADKFETTLQNELEHVRNFLQIHKNRVGERLRYEINVEAPIDRFICPRFILQPIVENSIIHGVSKLRKPWCIQIRIYEEAAFLKVEIRDNGAGIEAERLKMIKEVLSGHLSLESLQTESGGLGVNNVHERIKSFYGNNSGLWLENLSPSGLICIIQMYKGGHEAC